MRLEDRMPVFVKARNVIEELKIPYVVGGGIAVGQYNHQRPTKDMDFFIPEECAEDAIEGLQSAGFIIKRSDPRWLYQSWLNDTLVDLVFNINAGRGMIAIDNRMIDRGRDLKVHGEPFRIISPEDLIIIKILVQHENRSDWWDAITIMRSQRTKLDWQQIMRFAPIDMPKFLAFLLFVHSRHESENLFPEWVIRQAWSVVEIEMGILHMAA